MPSEMHSFLEWPIWKDFEEVPNEEGKVWRWPTVKRGNRLEEALDAGIFVV